MFAASSVGTRPGPRQVVLVAILFLVSGLVPVLAPWLTSPAAATPNTTQLVSVAANGTQGTAAARGNSDIAAGGRYVAFASYASNLAGVIDGNGTSDIFVRDRAGSGSTELISVSTTGGVGSGESADPSISADGRYVAFTSASSDLVNNDSNGTYDVFVRDRLTKTTELISVNDNGVQGNQGGFGPRISPDGRYVVFGSDATNLVPAGQTDGNLTTDVFVRDRIAKTTRRVSINSAGTEGNGQSGWGAISADGRYVVFTSAATNLAGGTDSNNNWDVFVRDIPTGTTERVSVADSTGAEGNGGSQLPSISADGRYVTFYSGSSNLVGGADNPSWVDIFVRDRFAVPARTQLISIGVGGAQSNGHSLDPNISLDGRYISYSSVATNLVTDDTNNQQDVFLYDRATSSTELVSIDSSGAQGNGYSYSRSYISADGRYVSFYSEATNLVTGDLNGFGDNFVRERDPQQAPLVGGAVAPETRRGGGSPSMLLDCPAPDADPCDVSTGNYYETATDISIPGRGMPLEFTRTYNSYPSPATPADGPLGYGWSFNYGMSLSVAGSTVTITEENGAQISFTQSGSTYTAPARVQATLSNSGGVWTFTRKAREVFTFNTSGQLTSVKDLNGNGTTLSYLSGKLSTATDSASRTLTFGWTGTHISSVTDTASPSRSVTFSYSSSNLTDVVDVGGGHTQYGYDAAHRMTLMRRPNFFSDGAMPSAPATCTATGPVHTTAYHYDGSGRIDCSYDPLGRKTSFAYATNSTTLTDPKGNVRVDVFTSGLLTARTLGSGTAQAATWVYQYDPNNLARNLTVDPNGGVTTAIHDASTGNALMTIDELGRTTVSTYNSLREPLTVRDPMDVTTTYQYDGANRGNLISESTPLAGTANTKTTSYTVDLTTPGRIGDVTAITDPDSKVWSRTWDNYGNLSSESTPLSETTTYCYDTVGRKTKEISPKGTAAAMTCSTANPTFTTLFTTDAFGDAVAVTDANGNIQQTVYDLNRNTVAQIDGLGATTTYTYNPADELIEQSNPWSIPLAEDFTGTSGPWNGGRWATSGTVNLTSNQGLLASAATPSRATAKTMADAVDSEATFTYQFSATANSTLRIALRASGADKTTGADMPNGYRLEINPNTAQLQLTKVVSGTATNLGATVAYTSGTTAHRVRYQVQGSVIRAKVWATNTSEPATWTVERTDSTNTTAGTIQFSHLQASGTQNVTIDDLMVLDAATPQGAVWTSPVRVADDFTASTGSAWNSDRWATSTGQTITSNQGTLVANGSSKRATAKAMPDVMDSEANFTYSFDNITAATSFRISLRGSGADKTTANQLDTAYRLEISPSATDIHIKKIVAGTVTDLGQFTYSLTGTAPQRVRFQVQGATIRAKIWALGTSEPAAWSLSVTDTTITTPGVLQFANSWAGSIASTVSIDDLSVIVGNSLRWDYNADGTVFHEYDGARQATTYGYDAQARLTTITDPLSRTTTYGYDPAGNQITKQDPGGNCALSSGCTTTAYDLADQLVGINYSDAGTADVTLVDYDLNGRRTKMVDGTGTSTWAWDSLSRLTSQTNGAGKNVCYEYDLRGNRTKIKYPDPTTGVCSASNAVTQSFDNAGQTKTVTDWLSNTTTFNYDANGFMTSQAYPAGTNITTTYSPDNAGGLIGVNHSKSGTPFAKFDYTRNKNGRLASLTETVSSPAVPDNRVWSYSANGQLKTDNGALYATDDAANLIRQSSGAVQGFDVADQMTSTSSISVVGATGAADSTSTSLPLTIPVGTTTNDQIILAATVPYGQTPTTPTGYTLAGTYTAGTTGKVLIYRKTASSSETTVTVNFGVVAYGKALNLVVYRGVNSTTPIDVSASITGTSTTSVTIPSVTPTVPGDRLVLVQGAIPSTAGTWSTPVSMTAQGNQQQPANGSAAGLITDQSVLTATGTGPRPITFSTSGALVGVALALKPNQTTYGYDNRGNRISITPAGGSTTNLTYDQANRLKTYGSSATYTYDGIGTRVSKTASGSTTAFTWDDAGHLLVEGSTSYVYGPDGVPLEQITASGVTYYHHDYGGSTRALTDSNGNRIATYTYDAYGKQTATTGSSSTPFRFGGQYTDPESGLISLLDGRYYEASTRQFLSHPSQDLRLTRDVAKKKGAKKQLQVYATLWQKADGFIHFRVAVGDWYEKGNRGKVEYHVYLEGQVMTSGDFTFSGDGHDAFVERDLSCIIGHWEVTATAWRRGHGVSYTDMDDPLRKADVTDCGPKECPR